VFPALLLVERRNGPGIRLALAAILVLTWTLPTRHFIIGDLPWPLPALGASWSAVPVFLLWLALARLAREAREASPAGPTAGGQTACHVRRCRPVNSASRLEAVG
jgi:hypothetical protein